MSEYDETLRTVFRYHSQEKPNCTFYDPDDVTLGSPAIFFETEMEFHSLPTGTFKDPWLSDPTSRWVWLYQDGHAPNTTQQTTFC